MTFNQKTMKKGQYVYYKDPNGATVPAKILKVYKTRAKIDGDFHEGPKVRIVSLGKLEDQFKYNEVEPDSLLSVFHKTGLID